MYPNVCVISIAVIIFRLEKVAGCSTHSLFSKPDTSAQQPSVSSVHPSFSPSIRETESVTCVQRYQGTQQNKIVSRNLSKQKEDKTYNFIIKVEKFDDNTEIYCVKNNDKTLIKDTSPIIAEIGANKSVFNFSTTSIFYNKTIIKVTAENDTPKENDVNMTLKYNETQNVLFSCLNANDKTKYVQLGIINTNSNMIETVPEITINQKFNITHDRTIILCCINYNTTIEHNERQITRSVVNKTMLVYDDGKNNDGNDNDGKDSGGKDNGLQDTPKGTVNEVNSDPFNTYPDDTDADNQTKPIPYVKAAAAVGAVIVILLFVVVIWKKRCRKKPKSDAKVLYADLDILRQTEPGTSPRSRPGSEEESPYAQIIGVMRPND